MSLTWGPHYKILYTIVFFKSFDFINAISIALKFNNQNNLVKNLTITLQILHKL